MPKFIVYALVCLLCVSMAGCAKKAHPVHGDIVWGKLQWGMTAAEAEKALGMKVEKMPGIYFGSGESYHIQNIDIEGVKFWAALRINEKGLQLVQLKAMDGGTLAFDHMLPILSRRYGKTKDTQEEMRKLIARLIDSPMIRGYTNYTYEWDLGDTLVFCSKDYQIGGPHSTVIFRKK